jgi:spore maturation protein CgeB
MTLGSMGIRVLFIGENWHGSNATSCKRAFRHLGCDVLDVDDYHFFPRWHSFRMRVLRKIILPFIITEFGNYILRITQEFHPDLVFVFKGVMVKPEIIEYCKKAGARTFNFYPDWDFGLFFRHFGNDFNECMTTYDVLFTPKSYHIMPLKEIGAKRVVFLPYAYDPWCHYPVSLKPTELEEYQSDIVFIGSWGQDRSDLLEQIVNNDFQYNLAIWGNRWENLKPHSPLRNFVKWKPAYGETQARIFAGCRIALAFIRSPDLHTARTFEIPAYGAFMLAQRTLEQTRFFVEGEEFECFETADELRQKIEYYLNNEKKRRQIAQAGYKKVLEGGNSYIDRMQLVLKTYRELVS